MTVAAMPTPPATTRPTRGLERAFLAAAYHVLAPGNTLVVSPGRRCAALERITGARRWCILTAFNPAGERLSEASNRQRAAQLSAALDAAEPAVRVPACNRDPAGAWPDEPGWLFSFASRDQVHALARRFGQLGAICGRGAGPAELWMFGAGDAVRRLPA